MLLDARFVSTLVVLEAQYAYRPPLVITWYAVLSQALSLTRQSNGPSYCPERGGAKAGDGSILLFLTDSTGQLATRGTASQLAQCSFRW